MGPDARKVVEGILVTDIWVISSRNDFRNIKGIHALCPRRNSMHFRTYAFIFLFSALPLAGAADPTPTPAKDQSEAAVGRAERPGENSSEPSKPTRTTRTKGRGLRFSNRPDGNDSGPHRGGVVPPNGSPATGGTSSSPGGYQQTPYGNGNP